MVPLLLEGLNHRKVPERRSLSDQELLDCIELAYGPERRTEVAEQLAAYALYPVFYGWRYPR